MQYNQMEALRYSSRKLVRELGILQLNHPKEHETPEQWHALIEVSKEPGVKISKLGTLLLMSISNISRLVKKLTKDGLLYIKEGKDKRERYLYLTPKGQIIVEKADRFSHVKIQGAFEFLTEEETQQVVEAIGMYAAALEKSRIMKERVKILTVSTSRKIRREIMQMIGNIQRNEFKIPVTDEINSCILKAEKSYYYNNTYNFWYAVNDEGKIIGSIGLKRIDGECGEVKKFFVVPQYRGKGTAQKLMDVLLKAAVKHNFNTLFLGTVNKLKAAQRFYEKRGFVQIDKNNLPEGFDVCPVDTIFFRGNIKELLTKLQ